MNSCRIASYYDAPISPPVQRCLIRGFFYIIKHPEQKKSPSDKIARQGDEKLLPAGEIVPDQTVYVGFAEADGVGVPPNRWQQRNNEYRVKHAIFHDSSFLALVSADKAIILLPSANTTRAS